MSEATMRAVRVHEWKAAPQLDEVTVPRPAAGETLVQVEAAAVAHLDATVASGTFDLSPELPYVGGVEGAGTVVESDVFDAGTRVLLRGGGLGLVRDGTWAEFVVAKSTSLSVVPEGMPPEVAATFFVPTTTAFTALHDVGRLGTWHLPDLLSPRDELVVVAGAAGAVGSMVVQLALLSGAEVIGLVATDAQRDLVAHGAEVVTQSDAERLAELAETRPGTLLVDTLGGDGLLERARIVRQGGRAAVLGYVTGESVSIHLPSWFFDDVAILPVNMLRREMSARAMAPDLAQMLVRGALEMQVETFPMGQAARALDLLRSGSVRGRAALVPSLPEG